MGQRQTDHTLDELINKIKNQMQPIGLFINEVGVIAGEQTPESLEAREYLVTIFDHVFEGFRYAAYGHATRVKDPSTEFKAALKAFEAKPENSDIVSRVKEMAIAL